IGSDGVDAQSAVGNSLRKLSGSLYNVPLATIVGGHIDSDGGIVLCQFFRILHQRPQTRGKAGAVTNEANLDVMLMQASYFVALQNLDEQGHQTVHFGPWPCPVLTTESKQCQKLNTVARTGFNNL